MMVVVSTRFVVEFRVPESMLANSNDSGSDDEVGDGSDDGCGGGDGDGDGDGDYHLLQGIEQGAIGHPWLASTVVPSCVQHFDPTPV